MIPLKLAAKLIKEQTTSNCTFAAPLQKKGDSPFYIRFKIQGKDRDFGYQHSTLNPADIDRTLEVLNGY